MLVRVLEIPINCQKVQPIVGLKILMYRKSLSQENLFMVRFL